MNILGTGTSQRAFLFLKKIAFPCGLNLCHLSPNKIELYTLYTSTTYNSRDDTIVEEAKIKCFLRK